MSMVTVSVGVAILWALALEIDERGPTFTGERVCRACGGRGEVNSWGRSNLSGTCDPRGSKPPTIGSLASLVRSGQLAHGYMGDVDQTISQEERERWSWRSPCPCDCPTRPDTILLHRLVVDLAAMRSPRLASVFDQWAIDADVRNDQGDTSWQHQWWLAFLAWTLRGIEPDAHALAPLLRDRIAWSTRTSGLRWIENDIPSSPRRAHEGDALTVQEAIDRFAAMTPFDLDEVRTAVERVATMPVDVPSPDELLAHLATDINTIIRDATLDTTHDPNSLAELMSRPTLDEVAAASAVFDASSSELSLRYALQNEYGIERVEVFVNPSWTPYHDLPPYSATVVYSGWLAESAVSDAAYGVLSPAIAVIVRQVDPWEFDSVVSAMTG